MVLQPVAGYNSQVLNHSFPQTNLPASGKPKYNLTNGNTHAVLKTTYLSKDSLTVNYTNKDGDSVSLSMGHIECQKAMIAYSGKAGSEEWQQIVDKVKEEYLQLQEKIIKEFLDNINGNTGEKTEGITAESEEIEGLPAYWNAENTSQRIVDFAVSFYDVAESSGKEYYEMMRNAIEEGFNQAMGMLGELPDEVNNLANRTYELAMQKLEAWAVEQGIETGEAVAQA